MLLYLLEEFDLCGGTVNRQKSTGVSHVNLMVLQRHLYLGREFQQAHVVGDRGTALTHTLGDFLLCHPRCLGKMLIGKSHIDSVQILTLDILYQCHLHHTLILHRADIGGDRCQTGYLGGAPAAFASDNLIFPTLYLTEGDGLDDTHLTDAVGKFLQRLLVKLPTGLVGIGLYL